MFNQEKPSSKIETVVRELRKLKVMSAEWHVAADGRNIKEKLYSEIGELVNWLNSTEMVMDLGGPLIHLYDFLGLGRSWIERKLLVNL